jgi:hypothetical protein
MNSCIKIITNYKQSGQSAVYALLLLPLLLAITWTILDVSEWNFLRDALLQEATTIAKLATNELPDTTTANKKIIQYTNIIQNKFPKLENLSVTPILKNNNNLENSTNNLGAFSIGVNIQADYVSSLGNLANSLIPELNFKMHINKSAIIQYHPGDYVIILANSHTLRPKSKNQLFTDTHPADIFKCPKPQNANSFVWSNNWEDQAAIKFWTQACYNPAFTTLKFSAISLTSAITEIKNNKIAILLTPGNNAPQSKDSVNNITTLRSINSGFILDNLDEANFTNSYQDQYALNNIACVLFSKNYSGENQYPIPTTLNIDEKPTNNNTCPKQLDLTLNILDKDFLKESIQLKEAIFWQIAQTQTATNPAQVDLTQAISSALDELLVKSEETQAAELAIRGNLSVKPLRQIFVLTDNLNKFKLTSEIIELLNTYHIKLTFIVYLHEFLESPILQQVNFDFAALEEQLSTTQTKTSLITLYKTSSSSDIQNAILPHILPSFNQLVVKSYEQ